MRRPSALVAVALLPLFAACADPVPAPYASPESVVHDVVDDVYLVSNVHGDATTKDGNGSICRVRPDGTMLDRRFIVGGERGVTLHAPKGMAITGDVLWVADIDVLRRFDRKSGRALGAIEVPGATFLNDVAAADDGTVYCSDTGLDRDFAATGTDAVWKVDADGRLTKLASGEALGQPNGLVVHQGSVYVVGWRDGAFYRLERDGSRLDLGRAPKAQLDGLVRVPPQAPGEPPFWLASSWQGQCLYRFDLDGRCTELPQRLEQPADLLIDLRRQRLVVPLFGADRLVFASW